VGNRRVGHSRWAGNQNARTAEQPDPSQGHTALNGSGTLRIPDVSDSGEVAARPEGRPRHGPL